MTSVKGNLYLKNTQKNNKKYLNKSQKIYNRNFQKFNNRNSQYFNKRKYKRKYINNYIKRGERKRKLYLLDRKIKLLTKKVKKYKLKRFICLFMLPKHVIINYKILTATLLPIQRLKRLIYPIPLKTPVNLLLNYYK